MIKNKPLKIASEYTLQLDSTEKSYVLSYSDGLVKLNKSATEILQSCDGLNSADDIAQKLQEMFPDQYIMQDIYDFLQDAYKHGWICYNV